MHELTADRRDISVLCVDDNEQVLRALHVKLGMAGGFRVCGALTDTGTLPREAARISPDVVLLDVDIPGHDPFGSVRALADRSPSTRVVMFSAHVRPELVDRAIDAGAWGFVSKSDGEDALVEALRRVVAGEFVLSPEVRACYDPA